jgi:hypothetical protein
MGQWMVEMVLDRIAAGETTVVSTAAVLRCGMARDAIRVGCSSWSRGLQSKRRDSVVVSYKVYTL